MFHVEHLTDCQRRFGLVQPGRNPLDRAVVQLLDRASPHASTPLSAEVIDQQNWGITQLNADHFDLRQQQRQHKRFLLPSRRLVAHLSAI